MSWSGLYFGYGTNGFADHSLDDVLGILTDLGYHGVALTLDHRHLDPYAVGLSTRLRNLRHRLDELGLGVVVETGARYLLDPWHKHHPTLLSEAGREIRLDLLLRAVRIAAELGAESMSFWSGARPAGLADETAWTRLTDGCARVIEAADNLGVPVGFEPEPGMFVDTLAGYEQLLTRLQGSERLGLTLDIGHCQCLEPLSVPKCVHRHADRLVNVQIDDMRRGVHEHLEFGAGEIDFPPVLAALREVGYTGLISVELPRHSHAAPEVAERSVNFLRDASRASPTAQANHGAHAPRCTHV